MIKWIYLRRVYSESRTKFKSMFDTFFTRKKNETKEM